MAKAKTVMAFMGMAALIGAADVAALESLECFNWVPIKYALAPCIDFIAGNDECPSPVCCKAFANTNPDCYCQMLNGDTGLGVKINFTKAFALPTDCGKEPIYCAAEAPALPAVPAVPIAPAVPATPAKTDGCLIITSFRPSRTPLKGLCGA
ncbi:hypothetical protein SUGI_0685020 [Cryptomeria japonica]|nr:hypothetical protein SUGI_0685020 [Cryptomeria japonica]